MMNEHPEWRRSSYSMPNNDCVELAVGREIVLVRDSKAPDSGELSFSHEQFAAFRSTL